MNTSHKSAKEVSDQAKTGAFSRALLALRVAVHPRIKFASKHVSGKLDNATPASNVVHTAILLPASRSCYDNAPCGQVELSATMLHAMLTLAQTYSFRVTEIAGGSHSPKSRHYAGIALDVDQINGASVSAQNAHVAAFMKECKKLGATEVLGPGSPGHGGHVHAGWPRGAD